MNPLSESETSLEFTRVFRAPRALVYAAWSNPAHLAKWWGSEDCETDELVSDFREGGKFRWDLTHEGERMAAIGEWRELRVDERIVFTWQWEDDPQWSGVESIVTVDLRDHPEGTELHLTHENFPSAQSRDNHFGGWTEGMGKLERLLAAHRLGSVD